MVSAIRSLACCVVALAFSASASAAQPSPIKTDLSGVEAAALQRDLSNLGAPIKSQRSLSRHMSIGLADSPLRYLSKPALQRFLASLEFSERGLSTFRYADLEAELTPTQIYEVLALFGQQHQTPKLRRATARTSLDVDILNGRIPGVTPAGDDCDYNSPFQSPLCGGHHDYRCSSPGTCAPSQQLICTDNC